MYKKQRKTFLARWVALWLAALGMWSFATLADAAENAVEGVEQVPQPPEGIAGEFPALSLAGAGDFDVLFWDVYTAALWAPGGTWSPDDPYALAIRYEREFDGVAIAKRSIDEIKGLGIGDQAQHEDWLAKMKSLFPDVAEGDQLTGLYFPGEKAVFFRNDERIGSIDDPLFAEAFFGIWLNEKTSAPELRERLLGMSGVNVQSASGAP